MAIVAGSAMPPVATNARSSFIKGYRPFNAIVITHAHLDHAGGAAELRERTRAPIIAHENDLPYYRREKPMTFCPTGRLGPYFLKTPLPHQKYAAFKPDVLLAGNATFDTSE